MLPRQIELSQCGNHETAFTAPKLRSYLISNLILSPLLLPTPPPQILEIHEHVSRHPKIDTNLLGRCCNRYKEVIMMMTAIV